METIIKSRSFAEAAGMAAAAAERDVLSPFSLVTLSGTQKWLNVTGCDGTLQISVRTECETAGADWSLAAPASRLARFAAALPDGDTRLLPSGGADKLTIEGGGVRFSTFAKEPISAMGGVEGSSSLGVPANVLRSLLCHVKYAMCDDETRKSIDGVHLACRDSRLFAVATDGKRLAHAEWDCKNFADAERPFAVTLPRRTVDTLVSLIKRDDDDELGVHADAQGIMFVHSRWCVTSKLVGIPYPNWRQVVPTDLPGSAAMDRATLVAALERVALVADAQNGAALGITGEGVKLSATSLGGDGAGVTAGAEFGDVKLDGGVTWNGVINPRYMLDSLKCADDSTVRIRFADPLDGKPLIIEGEAPWYCVLMPMRAK